MKRKHRRRFRRRKQQEMLWRGVSPMLACCDLFAKYAEQVSLSIAQWAKAFSEISIKPMPANRLTYVESTVGNLAKDDQESCRINQTNSDRQKIPNEALAEQPLAFYERSRVP